MNDPAETPFESDCRADSSNESSAHGRVGGNLMPCVWRQIFHRALLLACLVLSTSLSPRAERLPLKAYTAADGLPNNVINKIVRDSRAFLWFCTHEGLSRFDGYAFTNYGVDQGLPHAIVNDFLETSKGELWVATNAGLVLFDPRGEATAGVVLPNQKSGAPPMF